MPGMQKQVQAEQRFVAMRMEATGLGLNPRSWCVA